MYLNRLLSPRERKNSVVGLEFQLPGTSETIWARGQVLREAQGQPFHGTGIQITGITRAHQRLLKDFMTEQRIKRLRKLMATIRRNRLH
jgi:hypothetical protein